MKVRMFVIIGAVVLMLCPVVTAGDLSPSSAASQRRQFSLEVDMVTGAVTPVPFLTSAADAQVNSDFVQVSAVCTDCNGCPGPDLNRHIQVVLQAVNPVGAGAGAGNATTTRSTFFAVSPPEKNAIAAGNTIQLDFEVQLLACDGKTFKLYFDMCQPAPADATTACP